MQTSVINLDGLKPAASCHPTVERWRVADIMALFELPFNDLLHRAHTVSTLLSIKTGGCSEDCGYCPQAARYHTGAAKESGASRFCMGAAWRMGLQTCATLGMLKDGQAEQLKEAGLDYYNHNLDTAPEFYGDVITTRTYQDRLDTLDRVRSMNINVCSVGQYGATAESVPINLLTQVEGTPLHGTDPLDPLDFVRLSAGRQSMGEAVQTLCFHAGANSIFYGEKLLTPATLRLSPTMPCLPN
ncbi:unnamed protein product [Spirodela intermedia]|uniref:Biotin synthase n=1 Tax=Spirodela intermedia TaxID=51605 RepID=A0ABN7E7W8_SPIIN|nr:unnamed protein product [Spirodela intermedia]